MSNNNEINRQIAEIKGCIAECEEQIKLNKEAIRKLSEDLQDLCYHPVDSVEEVVYRHMPGEFHYYQSCQDFVHKRTCKLCFTKEEKLATSMDSTPRFLILKEAGKRIG